MSSALCAAAVPGETISPGVGALNTYARRPQIVDESVPCCGMNSAWIAVMGTILGGVLAASTALISQTLQAKRERQAKLADARRLAYVEYVQAAHALLEAADFAIDEKARKDGGAARYIQDELRAFHTARHAVSLLGAEATRSATIELSAAFGNYFRAIDDRPKTERDEARLAVVNVRRELLQAMRRELGVDEGVT